MGESRKSTTGEEQDLHKGGAAKRRGHHAKCHKFMTFGERADILEVQKSRKNL